jgi:threonylcarbamoyladenosine tRNA methylthiotransferase MtaB
MSLQSGSDTVLRRMRRAYTPEEFAAKVAAARAAIPGIAITTDLIVGFPGETDAEHAESLTFVEQLAFADAHIFSYSPRPGTRAATMPNQLPATTKRARHTAMQTIIQTSASAYRRAHLGQTLPVLWEHPHPDGTATGLTDTYLRIYAPQGSAIRNTITPAHLLHEHADGLWAKPISTSSVM